MPRRVAYLSTTGLEDFFVYDELTDAPLRARGVVVDTIPWRRRGVDWSAYDAVVVRSTWDYQADVGAFLDTLAAIDSATRLLNPLDALRWNVDKSYLFDLEARGVAIVPSRKFPSFDGALLEEMWRDHDELVVKPTVSANADDTFRLPRGASVGDVEAAFDGRAGLVQPFLVDVVREGEFSVFAFDGAFSHAILKTPAAGDFRVQEEHGGRLRAIVPDEALRAAAATALAALPDDLLYARVDFVRAGDRYVLMEAELIEPSLYFQLDDAAAERFADALVRRLDGGQGPG